MIDEADEDHDGGVTFEDFVKILKKKCNDPMAEFDSDND